VPRAASGEGLQVQQGEVGTAVAFPALEHVVAADVVLVAERREGRHADAEPGEPVEQRDPHPAGLHGDTRRAGARVVGGEGGVQARGRFGVGDAQAVGPDEPHAVRAADAQQGPRLGVVEACGDDEERPHACPAALLGSDRDRRGARSAAMAADRALATKNRSRRFSGDISV
jgi:hypothetical protein